MGKTLIHVDMDAFFAAVEAAVIRLLDNHGRQIIDLAEGQDDRQITPSDQAEDKSLSREQTFQHDTTDFGYLQDVLRLQAKELSLKLRFNGIYVRTVTLKVKYGDMKLITRSKSGETISRAKDIYGIASALLDTVEKRAINAESQVWRYEADHPLQERRNH